MSFEQDDVGDWIARLSCGHGQHVRHRPPLTDRPWVMTEEGRRKRKGVMLDCLRCDRMEFPEEIIAYSRTPVFTEETVPAGLLKDHSTKPGVWAKIHVEEGVLRYTVPALERVMDLMPEQPGVVLPEVLHHVEPLGKMRFCVEFYKLGDGPGE